MKIIIDFDGGNAEGIACYAYTISVVDGGQQFVMAEGYGRCYDDLQTNNVAEWSGALYGLMHAYALMRTVMHYNQNIDQIQLKGDSQLVIRQIRGEYSVKAPHLKPYHHRCLSIVQQMGSSFVADWNPREKNDRADRLTHVARKLK